MEDPLANFSADDGQDVDANALAEHYRTVIKSKQYPPLQLILDMQPYIKDTDNMILAQKGLYIFRLLFESNLELSRHDLTTFIELFALRLENREELRIYNAGVEETLSCLLAIAKNSAFVPSDANKIVGAVFFVADSTSSRYKDMEEKNRALMCEIVKTLLHSHKKHITKDFSRQTLVQKITAMGENEKRPSCLEILFPMYAFVARDWDLELEELEKLSNSFMRYFPIDIKTSVLGSAQKKAVGSSLSSHLIECMVANDGFAEVVFERLVASLDSSGDLSANSKVEVFRALHTCVGQYQPGTVHVWSLKIWDALKFEIWNGEDLDPDSIDSSLKTLGLIAQNLGQVEYSWENTQSMLYSYLFQIAKECRSKFVDWQTKYLKPTSHIVSEVGKTSPYAFYILSNSILPPMLLVWPDLKTSPEKIILLKAINRVLDTRSPRSGVPESLDLDKHAEFERRSSTEAVERIKKDFFDQRDTLVEIFASIIVQSQRNNQEAHTLILQEAILGFGTLFMIPEYLAPAEKGMIVTQLVKLACTPWYPTTIHKHIITALRNIARGNPSTFSDTILPGFLAVVPSLVFQEHLRPEINVTLEDVVDIAAWPCSEGAKVTSAYPLWYRNFESAQRVLIAKFDDLLTREGQTRYALNILAAICNLVSRFDENLNNMTSLDWNSQVSDKTVGPYTWIFDHVHRQLFTRQDCVENKLSASSSKTYLGLQENCRSAAMEWTRLAAKLIGTILRSTTTTTQNNPVFSNSSSKTFDAIDGELDFRNSSTGKGAQLVLTLEILSAVKPVPGDKRNLSATKAKLGLERGGDLLRIVLRSLECRITTEQRTACNKLLQVLIAKFDACKERSPGSESSVAELVRTAQLTDDRKIGHGYQTLSYGTAAILCTTDTAACMTLVEAMIEGLRPNGLDHRESRRVARSFRSLLEPSSVLSKANSITIPKFRNQKLYNLAVPKLLEKLEAAKQPSVLAACPNVKEDILIALGGILEHQEISHILEELKPDTFINVCLEGISLQPDQASKQTYIRLLREAAPVILDHISLYLKGVVQTLTLRFVNTLETPSDADSKTRIAALECLLSLIKTLPAKSLSPFRTSLLKDLDIAKGDVDSSVRAAAQKCRLEWMYVTD